MSYNRCLACRRLKTEHSEAERIACSREVQKMTKNDPRGKPKTILLPDPLSDRKARRLRWR